MNDIDKERALYFKSKNYKKMMIGTISTLWLDDIAGGFMGETTVERVRERDCLMQAFALGVG